MSNKYNKGNYGNSKARSTSSPGSSSFSPESATESLSSGGTMQDLLELLDSFGFDLTAMLLLFWCIFAAVFVLSVNLYRKLVKHQEGLNNEAHNNSILSGSKAKFDTDQEILFQKKSIETQQSSVKRVASDKWTIVAGNEDSKEWVRLVIQWLYQSANTSPAIITNCLDAWLSSLNTKSRKLTFENGVYVEFVRLFHDQSSAIRLSDVKIENEFTDEVLVTLKATSDRLVIQVRVAANSRDSSNGQFALFEIVLQNFSALLKVVCKPENSLFVTRFLERPETKVQISGPLTPSEKTFSPDLVINAILNVLTSTLVDLNFSHANDFPKYKNYTGLSPAFENTFELEGDQSRRSIERKLFVTIAKAHNLQLDHSKEGHEVYCSVEINEPKNKRKTGTDRKEPHSPQWHDHFLFELNEKSKEIYFEVLDAFHEKASSRTADAYQDECIGYGVANLRSLDLNPSEKLVIPLQSKRTTPNGNTSENKSTLEVELLLMEHKLANPSSSVHEQPDLLNTTKTANDVVENNNVNTNEACQQLNDIVSERRFSFRDPLSATSMLSHSDQYTKSSLNTIKSDNGFSSEGYGSDRGQSPDVPSTIDTPPAPSTGHESGAPRESRSLIRTIRKRLSFNKRSKSVERQTNNRQRSVTSLDQDERARSVPGSREASAPREIGNGKSKGESYLSLTSNTSFFSENSTLVLECTIDGEKKHYIVPYSKENKRKYRKRKGLKLHVYNDHLFVATRVASSMHCQVCNKLFPKRLGKQGYKCRECGFLAHKQCHASTDSFCPANGAAKLNFDVENFEPTRTQPFTSPLPEVLVSAPPNESAPINEKQII